MDFTTLLPLIFLVLLIPIFLSSRKQKRQMSEMANLQQSLQEGDVVMTTSGLRATVVDASYEDTIDLEIAEGVVTTWLRAAVREKVVVPEDEHTDATVAPVDAAPAATTPSSETTPSLDKAPSVDSTPSLDTTPSLEKTADPASDASRN